MSQPEIGRVIANRYQLVERISAGGMGEVYRALDAQMFDRVVAVKLLHQRLTHADRSSAHLHQRFQEEARISALLGDHPNIIKVHDYGLEADYPYLVMEFLGSPPMVGDSLSTLLAQQGPMPVSRLIRLARQICAGLHYAHSFEGHLGPRSIRGVIHRDIKPSNIFVLHDPTLGTQEETVKILDFGIAKIVSDMTLSLGTHGLGFIGSLMYASPEQLRGKRLDLRSDIYSLGIVLYEMVTGRLPLEPETDSVWAWIEAHTHLEPIPIAELDLPTPLPADLEAVILSCLAKDPERRPATMELLSQQLQAANVPAPTSILGGSPVPPATPHPPTPPPQTAAVSPTESEPSPLPGSTPASDPVLEEAASAILRQFRAVPRPRNQPLPWAIGALLLVAPTLIWVWNLSGPRLGPPAAPSRQPWTEDRLSRYTDYNTQRRAAVATADWQQAITLLDQMIVEYPEQAVELYLYRQHLEGNLITPAPLGLSEPRQRILSIYSQRWQQAILEDEWQQADQIFSDLLAAFPEAQSSLTPYREALEPVRAAVQFNNGSAAVNRLDEVIAQYPAQAPFLRRYRGQLQQNIRPSPRPQPLPTLQFRPRSTPRPTPTPTPAPTPIPSLTPLTVPTLQEAPDLNFVCRLQPDLSMCQGFSPQ